MDNGGRKSEDTRIKKGANRLLCPVKATLFGYSSATPLTVKKKFWIKSGYSVIIIYNETVERGCDKWAEIMKKESITN